MTNIINIERSSNMRATEIFEVLLEAGFTKDQSTGLTGVIVAIRTGKITKRDAEQSLEKHGFGDSTAEQLTSVFFKSLVAA